MRARPSLETRRNGTAVCPSAVFAAEPADLKPASSASTWKREERQHTHTGQLVSELLRRSAAPASAAAARADAHVRVGPAAGLAEWCRPGRERQRRLEIGIPSAQGVIRVARRAEEIHWTPRRSWARACIVFRAGSPVACARAGPSKRLVTHSRSVCACGLRPRPKRCAWARELAVLRLEGAARLRH